MTRKLTFFFFFFFINNYYNSSSCSLAAAIGVNTFSILLREQHELCEWNLDARKIQEIQEMELVRMEKHRKKSERKKQDLE